jgi:hypothetical protein
VVQGDIRDHRQVLHGHLPLCGDAVDRSEEARCPTRGEKLLRIGGSAGSAHCLRNGESDVEETVIGQSAASVAALSGGGDDSGVRGLGDDEFPLFGLFREQTFPTVGSIARYGAHRMTLCL